VHTEVTSSQTAPDVCCDETACDVAFAWVKQLLVVAAGDGHWLMGLMYLAGGRTSSDVYCGWTPSLIIRADVRGRHSIHPQKVLHDCAYVDDAAL
jgi:hypothetical protein